jgi:uncharacterized protein YjbI with pentapeptide repeats
MMLPFLEFSLKGADLRSADMRQAVLPHIDFRASDKNVLQLLGCEVVPQVKQEASSTFAATSRCRTRLDGVNLAWTVVDWGQFDEADLRNANLQGALLRGAHFNHARLDSAKLNGAKLQGARFDGACMKDATLTYAWMNHANFSCADLTGASFVEAHDQLQDLELDRLKSVNFTGAIMGETFKKDLVRAGASKDELERMLKKQEKCDVECTPCSDPCILRKNIINR